MIASEDPIVEVPIVLASASDGALKSFAIMDTHPVRLSLHACIPVCIFIERTVLNVGADGVLFVVDEVFGESVSARDWLLGGSKASRVSSHTP